MDRGSPVLLGSWQILSSYPRRDLGSTLRESGLLRYLGITESHDTKIEQPLVLSDAKQQEIVGNSHQALIADLLSR
jgi:hypothetical protein